MNKITSESGKIYIGMDVSQKKIEIFLLNADSAEGHFLEIPNSRDSLLAFFQAIPEPSRCIAVLETGTHSHWQSRLLEGLGVDVIVAHARDLHLIWKSDRKTDRRDAEMLARLARSDRKLLHPTRPLTRKQQEDILLIKVRSSLVQKRTAMLNELRGWLRSIGEECNGLSTEMMQKEFYGQLPDALKRVFREYLKVLAVLTRSIKEYDKALEKKCKEYPETESLRQVGGVGPVIALTFCLLIHDPYRFKNGRQVAAYFGLVPKRDQSGECDKQLGITKSGSSMMRWVLIQGANYIMGQGKACDLRRMGERISARGGNIAKRKAKVAVARKLCMVLLALWRNDAVPYDPDYKLNRKKRIA